MQRKKLRSISELAELPDEALINEPEVCQLLYISRTHLWRGQKNGIYPKPKKFGRMNRHMIGDIRNVARGNAS